MMDVNVITQKNNKNSNKKREMIITFPNLNRVFYNKIRKQPNNIAINDD